MKVNKAQIREAERNRIAKQYAQKITLLEKSIEEHSKLRVEALNKVQKTIEDNQKLREENDGLKEKIRVYEEWLDRMQDFCNLPENERMNAVRQYKSEIKTNEVLEEITKEFSNYFDIIYNFNKNLNNIK